MQEVSEPAAESLVNLSQNPELAGQMISMGMVKAAMDLLYKPESAVTQLLVMLLVNLTQLDDGISSLLQVLSMGSYCCHPYLMATSILSLLIIFVSIFPGNFILINYQK